MSERWPAPVDVLRRWAVLVPVAALLVLAWQRRWVADDAFINFRVLDQLGAGNGPVYNRGDRVEVATSPLWLAVVGLAHLVTRVPLEWLSVVISMAMAAAALVVAMVGARRLLAGEDDDEGTWWVPLGAVVFVAVPSAWDWTTGGLENGLSWLWLASSFTAVTTAVRDPRRATLVRGLVVVGLGVLVRPDFGPYSLVWGAVLLYLGWRRLGVRPTALALAAGLALPVGGQLFRMGYYGQLLPNTVYAKEGGRSWWGQGWRYLVDFAGTYGLVVPLVVVGVIVVVAAGERRRDLGWRLVVGATVVAALAHAVLVVKAGGDYMHARLLLAPWFALLLPAAAVPWRPAGRRAGVVLGAGLALVALWAGVAGTTLRVGPPIFEDRVFDARAFEIGRGTHAHPITVEDHLAYLTVSPEERRRRASVPGWHPVGAFDEQALPVAPGLDPDRSYYPVTAAGAAAYGVPTDVYVIDLLGLADRLAARVELPRRRVPGHEKWLRGAWHAARWVDPDTPVDPGLNLIAPVLLVDGDTQTPLEDAPFRAEREAARRALACGELPALVASSTEPLTVGRVVANLGDALTLERYRFPEDPIEAERELC